MGIMPVLKKAGRLTVPANPHRVDAGNTSLLRTIANRIRPKNVGSELPLATLSRAAGTILDPVSGKPIVAGQSGLNVGTVPGGVTAVEYGTGHQRLTVLTLTNVPFVPDVPANVEAVGAQIYTIPAGPYLAIAAYLDISFTKGANTNAVEIGVGSVTATGDVGVLGGTATFEDWFEGTSVADPTLVLDSAKLATGGGPTLFQAASSHGVFLNMAGIFTAAVSPATVSGTVTLRWDRLLA